MSKHISENEVAVVYLAKFREYGIKINDGGTSFQEIYYCPWCGNKLPSSLRDAWFEEMEKLNIDIDVDKIPKEYLIEDWWKK